VPEDRRDEERAVAVEASRVRRIDPLLNDGTILALGRWMASLVATLGTEVMKELGRFSRAAGPGAMRTP
jgi:hypothetical protein